MSAYEHMTDNEPQGARVALEAEVRKRERLRLQAHKLKAPQGPDVLVGDVWQGLVAAACSPDGVVHWQPLPPGAEFGPYCSPRRHPGARDTMRRTLRLGTTHHLDGSHSP